MSRVYPAAESLAHLIPFADLFEADGRYISRNHCLRSLPTDVGAATNLVAYCEVGVRASLFAVLHEAYTGQVTPVFDGSLMQWALEQDLPVAIESRKDPRG